MSFFFRNVIIVFSTSFPSISVRKDIISETDSSLVVCAAHFQWNRWLWCNLLTYRFIVAAG